MEVPSLARYHCIRWEELPAIELYMDQVISITNGALGPLVFGDGGLTTPAMVNNYVKMGLLAAPIKKRYTRLHVARLIVISLLKRVLSLPEINAVLEKLMGENCTDASTGYDSFCEELEAQLNARFGAILAPASPLEGNVTAQTSSPQNIPSPTAPALLFAAVVTLTSKIEIELLILDSHSK